MISRQPTACRFGNETVSPKRILLKCGRRRNDLYMRVAIVSGECRKTMMTNLRSFAIIALLAVTPPLAGCGINNIPTYEQAAKAQWSEVLNQYKRRSDLIPNLVESVKGFAEQEKSVLTGVVEARAKATQAQVNIPADILTNPEAMKKFQEAQNTLGASLGRLLAVTENYPDIKSGENFRKLQDEIAGTENRIAISRRDYIRSVQLFNTEINTIPGVWWKRFMYPATKELASFEIPVEETKTPKVDFGTKK
jgi:LemA protein